MAFITTGLPNGGHTNFFDIDYDDTLINAQGLEVAQQLMQACDEDYRLLIRWFRGSTSMPSRLPVHLENSTGGASWGGWGTVWNITLSMGEQVFGTTAVMLARYLLVSEVSEIFMRQRQFVPNYWFSASNEGNKGESLSCFLANEMLRENHVGAIPSTTSGTFAKASSWLGSGRTNFLNLNDANTDPNASPEISCGISFLNYLCHERGIDIAEIIANGSETFEGIFRKLGLGADSDAFPTFVGLVNSHYPSDNRLSTMPQMDNTFPVPEMTQVVATPQVSWVPIGLPPRGRIELSRPTPMDTLVMLSTDRPDLLDVPADAIIRQGQEAVDFQITVKKQPAGFTTANAAMTATYAGRALQRLVQVYAPSSWPMPALRIAPDTPDDPCADAFIEGTSQSFSVGNLNAFPNRKGLTLKWQINGATGTSRPDGTFVIDVLPAVGTQIVVNVVGTNSDGVTAKGQFTFSVNAARTGLDHELAILNCRIRHIVDVVARIPRVPIPQYRLEREAVLKQVVDGAKQLTTQAAELGKVARAAAEVRATIK